MAGNWGITSDLTDIVGIKSDLRPDLFDWIQENYHIDGAEKRVRRLVDLIIDTFLDENAPRSIGLLATEGVLEGAEARHEDFYNEDIEKGDIVSFTDKALSFGYVIQGRRRYSYRMARDYKGFKPKVGIDDES